MNVISLQELILAVDAGDVALVDALSPIHYEATHLPGAVNLPPGTAAPVTERALPDRQATIAVYCSGPSCSSSRATAKELVALGYTDVRHFAGGLQAWTQAGLPLEGHLASVPDVTLPPSCTLTPTDGVLRRESWAMLADSAEDRVSTDDTLVLTFSRERGVLDHLDQLVSAERACCSQLQMTVDKLDKQVRLTMSAPADAESLDFFVRVTQPH